MACVGIVGGLGVGATVHYYEKIAASCKVRGVVPDLVIVHADVDRGQGFVRDGKLDALADYLASFIDRLGAAGAKAAVLPAVTPHICIDELTALWSEIARTARPGARVIFRTAAAERLLPGRVPDRVLDAWRYEEELSRELGRQDRSSIYGAFHLYTLKGA